MADAAAAEAQPSHAQMIAEMQKAGFSPTETSPPQVAQQDPTHDQMIREMAQAGFVPPQQEGASGGFLDQHPEVKNLVQSSINALPAAGAIIGGGLGATAGSIVPGAGTAEGAITGAGGGAIAGSTAKDALNAWVFGSDKSGMQIAKDAANEGSMAMAGQKVGDLVMQGAGKIAGKIAEKVIPRAVIDRYSQAADAVNAFIGAHDGDLAEGADTVRKGMQQSLDEFRTQANQQISSQLEGLGEKEVDIAPTMQKLQELRSKLNPKLDVEQVAAIDKLLGRIKDVANLGKDAEIPTSISVKLTEANQIKQFLQDEASAAYRLAGESGGGTQLAKAAKQAAAVARGAVNEAAPEVAAANNKLAALHQIEDRMNMNMLRLGKPENALVSAGNYAPGASGGSAANAKNLRLLGELTGQDFLGQAQNLSAMKAFSGSSLLKHGAGAAAGAAVGAGTAEIAGGDPIRGAEAGGLIGGLGTSPGAVKFGMDVARSVPAQVTPMAAQTLGQAVMHGSGAANSLKRIGGGQ